MEAGRVTTEPPAEDWQAKYYDLKYALERAKKEHAEELRIVNEHHSVKLMDLRSVHARGERTEIKGEAQAEIERLQNMVKRLQAHVPDTLRQHHKQKDIMRKQRAEIERLQEALIRRSPPDTAAEELKEPAPPRRKRPEKHALHTLSRAPKKRKRPRSPPPSHCDACGQAMGLSCEAIDWTKVTVSGDMCETCCCWQCGIRKKWPGAFGCPMGRKGMDH